MPDVTHLDWITRSLELELPRQAARLDAARLTTTFLAGVCVAMTVGIGQTQNHLSWVFVVAILGTGVVLLLAGAVLFVQARVVDALDLLAEPGASPPTPAEAKMLMRVETAACVKFNDQAWVWVYRGLLAQITVTLLVVLMGGVQWWPQ